jgi:Putative auto-transporter adhesin, head GIN domain
MNTKYIKIAIGLAVILLFASACGVLPNRGSGRLITETRDVSGFNAVEFGGSGNLFMYSGAGNVEIVQDGIESITIETDDDVMEYVTTEVSGRNLFVKLDFGGQPPVLPTEMNITVHVRELNEIVVSGAWDMRAGLIESDRLEASISGAGNFRIDTLTVNDLRVDVSGAGDMEIGGEAASQRITLSGAGKYRAGDLQSGTATINISGAGKATLWVTGTLDVEISGAGRVDYYGDPTVSFHQSGAGSIHHLGDK